MGKEDGRSGSEWQIVPYSHTWQVLRDKILSVGNAVDHVFHLGRHDPCELISVSLDEPYSPLHNLRGEVVGVVETTRLLNQAVEVMCSFGLDSFDMKSKANGFKNGNCSEIFDSTFFKGLAFQYKAEQNLKTGERTVSWSVLDRAPVPDFKIARFVP